MTITIQSEEINDFYLYMEQDKYSKGYRVGVVQKQPNGFYGYPIDERYYATKPQALRRYRNLKEQVQTW